MWKVFVLFFTFNVLKVNGQQLIVDTIIPELPTNTGVSLGDEINFDAISSGGSLMAGDGNFDESIDLSKYLPTAGNQGSNSTCVGWALSYMKSLQDRVQDASWNFIYNEEMQVSPSYIYRGVRRRISNDETTCDKEINIVHAFMLLNSVGAVSVKSAPIACACPEPSNVTRKRISGFFAIRKDDYDLDELNDEIKLRLQKKIPIVIIARYDHELHKAGINWVADRKLVWNKISNKTSNHAMLIVGYNDSLEAFLVINSYGKGWGNNGYFWMSYKIVKQMVKHFFYTTNMSAAENVAADQWFNADGGLKGFNANTSNSSAGGFATLDSTMNSMIEDEFTITSSKSKETLESRQPLVKANNKIGNEFVWGFKVRNGWFIQHDNLRVNCTFLNKANYQASFRITNKDGTQQVTQLAFDENNRFLMFKFEGKFYKMILQDIYRSYGRDVAKYGIYCIE